MAQLSASIPLPFFGNDTIGAAAGTVFLHPGYSAIANATPIGILVGRPGTLANLAVRHNAAVGNGNVVAYTVLVNGIVSVLTVNLATGAIGNAQDNVNRVVVAAGDVISVQAVKAAAIGNGAQNVTATFNFTA